MSNVIPVKLSSVKLSFDNQKYNYSGSIQSSNISNVLPNYELIDYSYNNTSLINADIKDVSDWKDGLYKAYSAVGAFYVSVKIATTAGLLEDISDGLIMAGATIASKAALGISWIQKKLGYDSAAEKARMRSGKIENWTSNYVAEDWSEDLYNMTAKALRFDDEIAHGMIHTAGNVVGTVAGYTALTIATGGAGAAVMAGVGATSAAGNAAQKAFQNGATFNQAAINAGVSAGVGAASGAALSGIGGAARSVTSLAEVGGLTAAGAASGALTPTANYATEYMTYGKDKYGLSLEGASQYFEESGAGIAIATGAVIGGTSAGIQAVNSYKSFVRELDSHGMKLEDFRNEMKEAGINPSKGRELMNKSTSNFTSSTKKHKLSSDAASRNKSLAETEEYWELNKEVAKHGKTLQEYGGMKKSLDPDLISRAEELSQEKAAQAAKVEPGITKKMQSLESDSRHLTGLNHSKKGVGSMTRKIIDDSSKAGSLEQAAAEINDSVRYTMICDEYTMANDISDCMNGLKNDGYKVVKFKNSFDKVDTPYKGLNTVIESPDGTHFELQFHTEQSFSVKEETTHVFYEIARNKGVSTPTEEALANALSNRSTESIHLEEIGRLFPSDSFVN